MLLVAFSWLVCIGCGIAIGWFLRSRRRLVAEGGEAPLPANLPRVVVTTEYKYQVLSPQGAKMRRHYKGDNLFEAKTSRQLLRDKGTAACLYVDGENRG